MRGYFRRAVADLTRPVVPHPLPLTRPHSASSSRRRRRPLSSRDPRPRPPTAFVGIDAETPSHPDADVHRRAAVFAPDADHHHRREAAPGRGADCQCGVVAPGRDSVLPRRVADYHHCNPVLAAPEFSRRGVLGAAAGLAAVGLSSGPAPALAAADAAAPEVTAAAQAVNQLIQEQGGGPQLVWSPIGSRSTLTDKNKLTKPFKAAKQTYPVRFVTYVGWWGTGG